MPSLSLPILYSFRRCPYAMRARMALHYSNINCILREVDLKNKPSAMLEISPKGTVPVLQLPDGRLIEESLEIIYYSLDHSDPYGLANLTVETASKAGYLIEKNDVEFVGLLRKYKYSERYPEDTQVSYRNQVEELFLAQYDQMLEGQEFLLGKKSVADIAILPFIRQFALADEEWFFSSRYKNLIKWLNAVIQSEVFEAKIMAKNEPWKEGDKAIYLL